MAPEDLAHGLEQTSGKNEARRALAETRRSAVRSTSVVAEVAASLAIVREAYATDYIADKIRDIIRGAA